MFLNNLRDTNLLKESLCSNKVSEVQITNCVLDKMGIFENTWEEVSISNSNANETAFNKISFMDCTFYRSSLMNAKFDTCIIDSVLYSGNTLIKVNWNKCKINKMTIKQSTMQRASFQNCIVSNSLFSDFEGIYSSLKNSVFYSCRFENTYESGMNAFSGAKFENCIFVNCLFNGFPLRGVNASSCVLINCSGEITDDAECVNTYTNSFSLNRFCVPITNMALSKIDEAQKIIKEGM